MIESFLCLVLLMIVAFFVVVPVCINVFKEQLWQDIRDKIRREAEYEQLVQNIKRDMKKGKR